jgi:hypothetical protein
METPTGIDAGRDPEEGVDGRDGPWLRAAIAGTAAIAVATLVTLPWRTERPMQIAYAATSMVLFAVGVVGCLWSYVSALERSRVDEIGVANLYLLTGPTAPRRVKRVLVGCFAAQVVLALVGGIVGAAGLSGTQVNVLAFGSLVPMYGLAINSLWAVRHGRFGPRVVRRSSTAGGTAGGRDTQPEDTHPHDEIG